MDYEQMNNNKVYLRGKVVSKAIFSHEVFDEKFYEINLQVPRLSEFNDIIPITVSERFFDTKKFEMGQEVAIKGQFRSYNKQENNKSRLVLTVFVREVCEIDESLNPNVIELVGYVCKPPVFRTTPFKREICDVLLAVNRAYNKSDYIPCITWGRNARYVKNFEVGDKIELTGRIQSREYQKKVSDDVIENKVAYEISVTKISSNEEDIANDQDGLLIKTNSSKSNFAQAD